MVSRITQGKNDITLKVSAGKGAPGQAPARAPRGSARPGVRGITVHLEPDLWLKVKMLALHGGKSTQDLVEGWIADAVREHET